MAKKKHIVIDARIRRSSTGRPIARLLDNLQEIDNDHRYTVLVEPEDDWKPTNRNFTVRPTRFKNFSFNPINQMLFAWQLYKLKANLVHFTLTPQQPLFYFGAQTTFTHDLTMLYFTRAGRLPKWAHKLRMKGYRFLLWSAHRKAKHITVPTQYVADAVNKYHLFTNRKTTVTLEATDPPLPGRAKKPETVPEQFIMYTGSAFPHKNLERLISAFCILKEHHSDLKLVIVGKREYHSKQLERWAKKQPCYHDIIFTGFISDEELKWYYQNARAYIFPSLSEGFGLPGLEAMVHGCPVVSSDMTCLPEVNGDGAEYFNPKDVQEMAEKIDKAISNEAVRKKLILKGYENTKKFSWRRFTNQHLNMFKSILKED